MTPSERQEIKRRLLSLRRQVHLELSANNGNAASRLLSKIGELEGQLLYEHVWEGRNEKEGKKHGN